MTRDISKARQDVYEADTKVMQAQDELQRAEQHHRMCVARERVCERAEALKRAQERRDNHLNWLEKCRQDQKNAEEKVAALNAQIEELLGCLNEAEVDLSHFAARASAEQKSLQIRQNVLAEKQDEYEQARRELEKLEKQVGDNA